ncbi:hypothetical protein B0H13DRAFT_2355518 [Mycena leptocephala]|nr:hypothetical protein B0H13DRAFT_2355518 [Mycena leptocephala]
MAGALADAGFQLEGPAAALIGVTGKEPNVYVATSQVNNLLQEQHLKKENLQGATYEYYKWNMRLVAFTILFSLLSTSPYIPILIQHSCFNQVLYPILRITGSSICVAFAQFVIQSRIKTILSIPPLATTPTTAVTPLWVCQIALVAGIVATACGCFSIVQQTSSQNTLIWLGLEAVLSILRVWLWGTNPSSDEITHIKFHIRIDKRDPRDAANERVEGPVCDPGCLRSCDFTESTPHLQREELQAGSFGATPTPTEYIPPPIGFFATARSSIS